MNSNQEHDRPLTQRILRCLNPLAQDRLTPVRLLTLTRLVQLGCDLLRHWLAANGLL